MNDLQIHAELMHNVFGMTLQWSVCFYLMIVSRSLPTTTEECKDFLDTHVIASVVASRSPLDDAIVLHDVRQDVRQCSRCPFRTPSASFLHEHVAHPDQALPAESPAFGRGLRRCPGEYLTYHSLLAVSACLRRWDWTLVRRRPGRASWLGLHSVDADVRASFRHAAPGPQS